MKKYLHHKGMFRSSTEFSNIKLDRDSQELGALEFPTMFIPSKKLFDSSIVRLHMLNNDSDIKLLPFESWSRINFVLLEP